MFSVKCKLCAFVNNTITHMDCVHAARMQFYEILMHAQNSSAHDVHTNILLRIPKNVHAIFHFQGIMNLPASDD